MRPAVKHSIGAVATPAPTCPEPSEACRIPVVTFGVMPSSTTLRASTPSGVPVKPIAGSVNRELVPAQIARKPSVAAAASAIVPPRNAATAGELPAAGPPSPVSSRTALSPMSGAAVSGPWPAL
jgi:hypothetical protein